MSGGVSAIDRELVDYKIVASDLRVGVNHLALDEERIRQEQFFEGILDLQQRICQNPDYQERYSDEVDDLKNKIRLNADALSYLKSITKLELPLTDLTNKITQAAIDAASPSSASSSVFANKALTENVNSCWEHITQLSLITQIHLKDAASYQQFHHMANEVDAHIDKMIEMAETKMIRFDPQGTVDESIMLAKELEADHVELTRTWDQTCQLTGMARYMKSLRNRHSRVVCGRTVDAPESVAQQVVMVKALIDFSGPDFAIRKGEEMILMSNENPNFWRVKTTFGEREAPSIIFTTIGPNQNEVFKANSLQKKCVSDWKRVLERTKGRLVKYYATLFERYCQHDVVYFAHEDAMNAFLDDIDSILIAPNYDSGILHHAYEAFTNTLMLLSPNRRPPRGAVALTESDIRVLHTPLRLLLNQMAHVDQVQARVSMTADEVQRYLKSVEDERQHIYNEIARMEQLQKEKENQLKSLANRMVDWKNKRRAFDRSIADYTSEPVDDILKHFPSTRLTKPNVVGNNYRSSADHYETDVYEPSNKFRNPQNSSETPSSDYGQVAKQMVTSHTRPKPSGMKFAGGVIQESATSRVWAGNAMSLRRSASTNDLQTQILRVTISASTQCDETGSTFESDAFYDANARRQTLLSGHGSSVARVKAELNTKGERNQNTTDVQAQIIRVTKNASSQVGVRVMPKAIDLSRVDIDNLGLEVQNSNELTGLGLRVGQVLCPVTVGTSMDLVEGPGVQVMGINDIDSINLQLRDSVAHATTDAHRRLKVRDVQAQIFSRSNSPATASIREDLLGDTQDRETVRSEVQAQVGIINKAVGVQAMATMEVVNIPSQKPKKRIAEGATASLCLLPGKDTKSVEFIASEPSTSTVMTQISCLLHSRGIHSDLESYLSDYKKRNGLHSETLDLCTQKPYTTSFAKDNEKSHENLKPIDVETFICKVVHDVGTQVSSKLVPTEVTVGKIGMKNMEVSFVDPLRKVDIDVPVDSLICPANMKFEFELYEGSGFELADYSGLSDILVTHDGSGARGSVMPDEVPVSPRDSQTRSNSGLKTQAAIALRIDKTKSAVGEVVASSKYIPKLKFVVADIAGPSIHAPQTPTSDLQTQISDIFRSADGTKKMRNFDEYGSESTRRYDTVEGDWSANCKPITEANITARTDQSVRVIGEVVCSKCHQKYREIQMQFDPDFKGVKKFSSQTQICNVVSDSGTQSQGEGTYGELKAQQRSPCVIDAEAQVAVELIPAEILMSRCDIENMDLEFEEDNDGDVYKVRMKSVTCPAKVKVKPHLVEGSGVYIAGIKNSKKIAFSVCSENMSDTDGYAGLQSSATFELPIRTTNIQQGMRSTSKLTQQNRIRLIPWGQKGQKTASSDTVTQILSVTTDASVQVGTKLVPQAIGIAPVHLENMEVSVANQRGRNREQTLSASALLYPAQVELRSKLMDEQSGIEVVPLDQVEVVSMSSPEVDPLVHYTHSSSGWADATPIGLQTQERRKSNLLPASLVMETSQFDGRLRTPELASQALVCELLSGSKKLEELTIRAKPAPKGSIEYSGDKAAQQLGYVAVEAVSQTVSLAMERLGETNLQDQNTSSSNSKHSVEVQVGTRLVPKALKVSQMPITNLKFESISSLRNGKESFLIEAARCPAEIVTITELCEDSGIFICSLDQPAEIGVGMCEEPVPTLAFPRTVSKESSNKKVDSVSGSWESTTNKSLRNASIKLPVEGIQANSSNLLLNESSLRLQAEVIVRSESGNLLNQTDSTGFKDSISEFKLVAFNASTQSTSKPAREAANGPMTPKQQLLTLNPTMSSPIQPNVNDHGIQVGVRLVPISIEIKPIKLENMEAVLTNKTTLISDEIDVSAILCSSAIQYNEVLTEVSGVHVVQIDNSTDISLNYCGNQFATSAIKSAQSSIDGKKLWIKRDTFSNTSNNYLRSSKAEDSDSEAQGSSEFVATLRVKDMQSSAERRLVSGFTQGKMNLKEVNLMHSHVETNENGVQVGLSLVPKAVKVESIRMENLDVVNERGEEGNTEQISVSAMLCSRPTQYDEILTESRGVTVLPITSAEDIHIAHKKETHYATIESQKDVGQQGYYACTNADIGNSYLARPQARIRVHHTEFSADTNDQTTVSTCDNNRSKLKIDGTTQVGATFIPTELKMQEMRLGFQRVQSLSRSMRTETVLCPTDIGINSILNECSGIEIAPIRGISELSIHLAQGQFSAEVLHDSGSNQMCIELKEKSISTSRQFPPKFTPLVEPTVHVGHAQSTTSLNQMTYSSNGCTMNSKLVQVGTLLIPTAVTMEKVKVNNLEVEVPLSPARSAEVNVSAVLASSATELTSVLTNDSGIHVVPVSKVNEVEIDANGGSYKGTINASAFKRTTGTFQRSANIADSSSACAPGVQKIVIPISASNMVGSASSSVEYLLRQSKDLSQIHEALQSVQTTLSLQESDTMSVPSYRRPGLLRISEQSFTPVNGSVKMPSNPSDVEFKDSSAQLGLRLVPHAVEVRDSKLGDGERVLTNARTPTHQEVEIRGILCSSAIPHEQILGESIGVNAEPIKAAKNMNIKPDQTRPAIHSDATTQVGAIVMPQQQSMHKIGRETGNFTANRTLSRGKIESNIYTTRLESSTELCEGPGITIANFDGCISTRNNTIENSDDSIPRVNNHTSPYPNKLKLEGPRAPYFETSESNIPEVHETSICQISKRLVSSASQVGTLLVPAKVCMDKIAVDQLVVDVPLTEWRTLDLSVSAILASTATEMVPLVTDTPGIQIIEMKDLDELGIQVGDEVYVASVVAPPVKYVNAAYGPTKDFGVGTKSASRKQEVVYIPVPKATEAAHLTHRAENLLNQSTELRKVHALLQSSSFQPRIRIASTSGTSMHLVENVDAQQSTTSKPSELSVYTCPCGRQYGLTNSISRPITELYNSSGTCGIMEGTSGSKMQESYHVACEATIKPEMFSKRLTANILTSSNDSRSRFTAAVPSKSFPCDGVQVMSGRNFNQEIEHAPRSMDARDKPALQVETQCAMAKMSSAVADLSKEELSKGDYAINLLDFGDSLSRSTHRKSNDTALETLRRTSWTSVIGPIQKRTHSADSRTQKKTEQLCINCQNKLLMTETSATEFDDPNSLQAEIIIRRSSDVDLFETSQSTRTSIHRQSFFSRDSRKRLSGSFDSLKSQSLTMKCAMCHTDLTSGDLTTSIRTSTSSLLGSEAVINMSLKEVAEAYVRICRTAGQFDGSAATKDRASLYQALKHNRIIQAVIADYEKEKNEEGKFILESKEIADVVAMTDKEIGYCVREPSTYSNLRNNTLVKKVVESYETYKCKQRTDIWTQTDLAQMETDTFPNSDVKEIAEVVGAFEKSQGQVSTKKGLYADLKGNPIIQRVIEEYELNRGVYSATKPSVTTAEAVLPSAAASKMGILSVDGQVAKMESEQFASTRLLTRNSCAIIRKVHKSKAEEKPISSSVSSDSEDEDNIQNWRRTQCSPASLEECIRFDVACSALITPETWDKKIQVDLTYNH